MVIDEKLLADLALANLNYKIVCDFFGLTEKERMNPNAAEWMIDCIKQFQTASTIVKSMRLRSNENQNIANYTPSSPLPTNPLLPPDTQTTA